MNCHIIFRRKIQLLSLFVLAVFNTAYASSELHIQVTSITSAEFERHYSQRYIEPESTVITTQELTSTEDGSPKKHQTKSLTEIKEMLQGRVVFNTPSDSDLDSNDLGIMQIRPADSSKGNIDLSQDPPWFVAYFPEYETIVYEGGHMYEGAYDLRTGDDENIVGSPYHFRHSPSGQWRISGRYNGQECNDYFLAKRSGEFLGISTYQPIHRFETEQFCSFNRAYWLDDASFYVEESDYQSSDESKLKYKYSKMTILDN